MRVSKRDLNDFAAGAISNVFCRAATTSATGCPRPNARSAAHCRRRPVRVTARSGSQLMPEWSMPIRLIFISNTIPPPVVIEQVLVEQQEQNTNGPNCRAARVQLTLPRGSRNRWKFATPASTSARRIAPAFTLPPTLPFRTAAPISGRKLVPGRFARVTRPIRSLTPYQFQVQACNEDGVWNRDRRRVWPP